MKTDMELRQERDAHRKAARQVSKLLRQRSRQAHGLGPRKKGMGVRIGDRDEAEKVRRGYVEAGSYVRRDGSEKLVGGDWIARRWELKQRSDGFCERWQILHKPHMPECEGRGTEPHHIVKRSVRRDDRASNLALLSHACHLAEDERKIRSGGGNHGKNSG